MLENRVMLVALLTGAATLAFLTLGRPMGAMGSVFIAAGIILYLIKKDDE